MSESTVWFEVCHQCGHQVEVTPETFLADMETHERKFCPIIKEWRRCKE